MVRWDCERDNDEMVDCETRWEIKNINKKKNKSKNDNYTFDILFIYYITIYHNKMILWYF